VSVTNLSRRLDVCSVTQQQLDDWNTTLLAGDVQRREAVLSHVYTHHNRHLFISLVGSVFR